MSSVTLLSSQYKALESNRQIKALKCKLKFGVSDELLKSELHIIVELRLTCEFGDGVALVPSIERINRYSA